MDIAPEKLCKVLVSEDSEDDDSWEWFRCPHCNSMKFYCENANTKAVYVRIRCMNCGEETKLKISSNAEKKQRNNMKRKKRKKETADESE